MRLNELVLDWTSVLEPFAPLVQEHVQRIQLAMSQVGMAEELRRLSVSEISLEPLCGSIADGLDLCTQRACGRED